MRDPVANSPLFPVARCGPCERTVLTYVTLAEDGGELRRCVHCDAAISGALEWIPAEALEADGYSIGHVPRGPGCGHGGGGCGSCPGRGT